ncbi:hypothetical protein T265_07921 [Opisthorchis viverrini]|uniref:Midasin n=1 Tax=Opisthorchis viverrini TaxID=6198 RepID=A0A074ZAS2_OPIVI|nr:hypothetical protein T265_07921 [Opisthorchis viverrini]KER24406.1 hypothetical protein T265_07921 [Opisthorchis viverrini]
MHGEKRPATKKDLGIWVSSIPSFSLHHEKSAQKAFAVLRMIGRTFSRSICMDVQILYGAYVRPLLEYANQVVYSGRTKDITLIERARRAATRMFACRNSVDCETRLAMLDPFPLEYRRLRGGLIPTYALFEQSLANKSKRKPPVSATEDIYHKRVKHESPESFEPKSADIILPCLKDASPVPVIIPKEDTEETFVRLPLIHSCIASLSVCTELRKPVLLAGPVGCGKTRCIDFVACLQKASVCRVQISEQTDSKSLLGAYCCTETPGQFVWRPGPLLTSLTQGSWLVLEDVDRGPADLQMLLAPLFKPNHSSSHRLDLIDPTTGLPVDQHRNFRILMTRRLVLSRTNEWRMECDNPCAEFIDRHCSVIMLPSLTDDSLRKLVSRLHPSLHTLLDRVLTIYGCVRQDLESSSAFTGSRTISPRDLLKFCARISRPSVESLQSDSLLLHAVDCFVACVSDPSRLLQLASKIAGELNLTAEKVMFILYKRSVDLRLDPDGALMYLGRAQLPCHRTAEWEARLAGGATLSQSTGDVVSPFASTHLACTLLERLAVAVEHKEPVLLVGETGTGKTSAIQQLAHLCGRRLRVINLNQQSDSVDLLGGFKPVDTRSLVRPVRERFEALFCRTFRMDKNVGYLEHINEYFNSGQWRDLITLMQHPTRLAVERPAGSANLLHEEWLGLLDQLNQLQRRFENAVKTNQSAVGFAFIEGALVRAVQDGDWVLLDEINLAPAEMLDCLSGLLDSEQGSVTLVERGDKTPLKRNPDFHLFAAMNPSTDVGKRELPVGLRNRFTEIYVPELDPGVNDSQLNPIRATDREDLAILVRAYLLPLNPSPTQVTTVVRLYAALRQAAVEGLVDGVGQKPHFSLRTLCRALVEAGRGYHGSTIRSLYEGLIFSFGSQLSRASRPILDTLVRRYLALIHGTREQKLDHTSLSHLLSSPLPMPAHRSTLKDQSSAMDYLPVEGYWVPRGPGEPRQTSPDALVDGSYVLTPSVRANLKDLARVVAAGGSLPILLQGETSVGKTSLITYLAERIGQVCYRINNHEHTEQQTYLGTYTVASATAQANMTGQVKDGTPPPLVFQHGPLVQAMRLGHWIILDELNLAPTEILEALNRVLDDNRTLFIPDTQEVIRAHPQFRLFATQNPPGLYAGRKVLSRALRNRFIELHFDPIPRGELEVILEKRCALPQSRAHRLVEVMHRLQLARCQSNVFLGKDSFITLRDLFRWAERYRLATCDLADPENDSEKRLTFFDWDAYLAEQGYLLLSGRVRNAEETRVVAEALETVFKRPISEAKLFDLSEETSSVSKEFLQPLLSESDVRPAGFEHVVWTRDMRRMLVLVGNALKYKEPILLVGETSCGKTTVCQLFAALKHQKLHCVNCHQYTEASDFLGGLRPIRRVSSQDGAEVDDGRLFEWVDGPLVVAMSRGEMFLLDEISLADDAVLERLNSLLEPERRLNLAERSEGAGSIGVLETNDLTAHIGFRLVATMNPGGDYGKKELSPALRNRFTEIWCPTPAFTSPNLEAFPTSSSDLQLIVVHNLKLHLPSLRTSPDLAQRLSYAMVDFASWFSWALHDDTTANHLVSTRKSPPTIRDLLAWIQFMESVCSRSPNPASTPPGMSSSIDLLSACLHGACLVFLDAVDCKPIGILENPSLAAQGVKFLRERLESIASEHGLAVENLFVAVNYTCAGDSNVDGDFSFTSDGRMFGADPFYIDTGPSSDPSLAFNSRFNFSAPTPAVNLRRLLRALQVPKRALLLEGSPGVGKTSLVLALAKATGHEVVRINLSEATEASDLLGCDLPVEGAAPGVFAWRDGPLLQGLREGRWIVLDEMNLASQSVLECLNACLDHRGELYIPELGATFKIQPGVTRLFACQNPVREGGGRKGLPKSFLNRFTQVFLQPLTTADQEFIMQQLYPRLPAPVIQLMVHFNWKLADEVNVGREFGTQGGPWEFNLRDLMRWAELILKGEEFEGSNPGLSVHYVYTDRMRTEADKRKVAELWNSVCRERGATDMVYYKPLGRISIVNNTLRIGNAGFDTVPTVDFSKLPNLLFLDQQRSQLESLLKILEMGWMAILVGPPGCAVYLRIYAALPFSFILHSPSVLDRLNSVLEPDGELVLSERGLDSNGRLIRMKPHPDFRLILIVDEVSGLGAGSTGVSRAMRNRGVEIAVYKDLSMTNVDLDRILTSMGIRNSVVNALTSFQALFSTACGLTCLPTDHINLLDGLPVTAGLLKRPPLEALLSCSQLAECLLQNPETDEAEPRQLFVDEPEDDNLFLTFDLERPKTVWCWALSRALNFAYSSRQTHAKAASVVRTLINRFLSVVSDEISLESMYHHSGVVGPRYLLHSLRQLISCGNPVEYRQNHIHVVALAISSTQSSPPPPHLIRRVLLEQANSADLGGLPGHVKAVFGHVCLTPDLSDYSSQATADPWELWPDLRWAPGWRHLTNSLGGPVLEWDRVLRTLLVVELLQMQLELIPPKSSTNQSFGTLSSLSVLVVAHKFSVGQIPPTWLENYPGLNAILDQWTQFLQAFVADRTVASQGTSHAYWLSIIQRVGLIWTWLHHFALKPLGDPQDWSDRLEFHNQRANLSAVGVNGFIPILSAIRSVLSLPVPRVVSFSNSEFSPMTLNCVSFGKKIGDLLQLLQFGELEEEDEDDSNDESLADEEDLVHQEGVRDNLSSNLMCLWPLSMLSILHTIYQMAEVQRQSESLRAFVRCLLLSMTRPQLMSLLSLAQPCHVTSSVQKRAVEQSLLEISEKQAFEQLCARLDLVSTGRLLPYRSFGTLERPSLINEWRSLGQATFAITWPALSRYNMGAEPTYQTLFGWFNSQKAYKIAHVMLSSHVRSPNDATYAPCRSSNVNDITLNPDLTDLVLRSGQLLHAVDEALVTKIHSPAIHHAPMHPDSSFSETHPDLDSLLQWIVSKLQPRLSESVLMASVSPNWSEILQLCEWLIGYLLKIKDDPSNNDLIGIAWTLFGCLYVRCVCPVAPLDPYIVARVEEVAVATELERVDREIELRRAIRRISFGDPSGALPKDGDDSNEWFSATNLQGLAEAGLEHPWISAIVTYREQLVEKSEQLAKHNVISRGPIPLSRQVSNIQYSQLRRRLSTFVVGFTEKLLLHRCSNQGLPQLNPDSIQRWLEVASDLAEWLTEPERFHTFADIVEPLLHGVLATLVDRICTRDVHWLQSLLVFYLPGICSKSHKTIEEEEFKLDVVYSSRFTNMDTLWPPADEYEGKAEAMSATVTDLVGLLSTGLMSNQTVIDRPLSLNCLSSSLYLAYQLTSVSVRNTLKQAAIAVSLETNPSGPTQALAFQVEFRLFSLILDLIWLHHVDSAGSHDYQLTSFTGRLLAFLNRPLARRWHQAEADRKKAAAERAALFIEAASRKHRIQGELQQGSKSKKDNARDVQADLIDPDLVEEVEWRLRFPETASLNALAEMSAESGQLGLGREEQIQQTVRKLEQVDKWLERALGETTRTWIPDESELIYWVDRTVELLLSQATNVVSKDHASEWRWHTLLNGYSMASWLTLHSSVSLDPSTDKQSLSTLLAITAYLAQNDLRSKARLPIHQERNASLDVYRDPIPLDAASRLLAVLEHLERRVRQILHEWPGQPSLLHLLTLIRRLEGFHVSDPLMKFLTGVEMIWQEMHEWEKNASRHVSLMDQIKEVCELLIEWRKMELKCWLSTLDTATSAFSSRAATLWFHLHDVFLRPPGHATSDSTVGNTQSESDRCEVLVELMENGPLGEFPMRWRLLAALRTALDIWPGLPTQDRETNKRIVGNVAWFYGQFLPAVQNEIKCLRKPIEKDLRGVVHITKWGDYACFWSVKSNVDRCKRTIHKQVRNWETILRRPVRPLFETAISVPRFERPPNADCPDMPVSSLPSASDAKNYWLSPQDFQWICTQRTMNPQFGSHFGRLPTLVPKFHVHLRRMASGSPVTHWIQQLQTGTEAWAALLTDLETCTRQLESTCPPAHLLRQLHAAKSTGKRKVTGSDNTEELEQARRWNQQFTTLQQRKRWALSQWFKVAGNPHRANPGENAPHSCSDLDCDTSSDAVDTELPGPDVDLNSYDDDNTSLPQLGLSYLRGQRYSHTGSMTSFLSQLSGDPWRYVHSHEGTDLYRIGSKEYTLPTIVCRRLACLVALRGGLPRTPGPPGATPETVSEIVTELGGPTNLARLTGLADDLLNNCVAAIRSCSQLTEAANQLFVQSDAFRSTFDGKADSCSSDVAKDDVIYVPLGSDHIQLRRIRTSVKTVGQLARDALQQCTLFWGVCHQLQSTTPVTTDDLKCIFGSDLWENLVAPVALPSIKVFADFCRHICANYLDRLTAAVEAISENVNLISASPTFLLTHSSCQIYVCLSTALESFLSISDAIVSDCRQNGFHNNVESSLARTTDRLRFEYQFLSTIVTQNALRALRCDEISKEECDSALCVLTDNLIQSILRTLGTLYHADRYSEDMGQIDLLLHFSDEMSVSASDLILAQVNKLLTRCRVKLEQSQGDVLTSGVRLTRAVFPLVDALSKAVELRATQFWQLLDEWTRLGERVLRITGRLLVDGFCRPAGLDRSMSDEANGGMSCDNQALDSREQEGSGGGTSLTAEGVDTTGAKDVSKELECQEQIEGLMDETQKTNQADDHGAAEDESEGIEMPDDNFRGEFGDDQPLGIDEQEDELSSAEDTQDLENRMGDGANGASDEVFKEMWASDNEEEPASALPPAENDAGGVQDQTDGKQDEKDTKDGSDVQRQKKSLDSDHSAQEENEEANSGEAESSPPSKKGPKSVKDFQNKTTVAGDDGQMPPNNEQELTPDAESEQDHSTDGDQARKEDDSLAALEAKRLEDEEESTGNQTEDLPDDLPDEAMNSPSEEAANADSGKPEEESGQDEVDPGYEDQIMPLDQGAEDQTELQDPKMEDFQYNPASGDLGQDKATAGLDGAPVSEDTRPTEHDREQDSVHQLPEQTEQSTGSRGGQRVGTGQFGDLAPDQIDAKDRSAPAAKTEGIAPKRRSGLKPVSENRSQDPSATDAMKKKEILDPAKSGQVRSPEIDQEGLTDADLYEHMEEDTMDTGNDSGIRAFDSATESQRKQQTRSEQKPEQADTDVGLENDEETREVPPNLIPTDVPEEQPLSSGLPLQQRLSGKSSKGDLAGEDVVESDPDARIVATLGAQRPPDSFICTRPEALVQSTAGSHMFDVGLAVERADLHSVSTEEAKKAFFEWSACSARSAGLARQLCESLRLVLEPTKAARMRGDYRTGKRINMRKIIPYLASHFRKDKIWLRRSQPSQREYRILIAVDDSSSMSDNLCRQMTFDSLATVVTALNLLEVGRIGVCSFGESVRILHDLQDTWVGDAGANVLAQFTFKQSRTSLIQLLQSAIKAMQMCNLPTTTGSMPSQLLLILSDGVFSEDPQDSRVQAAVRLARDSRLFPVCLILDDVRKKHSIFDLRRYTSSGKLVPYMDTFPLPFYLVLRDVTALPQLLSDALRQWFELEASFGR